ncbi:MAG: hypothetical protein SGI98_10215 [Verrucomicrobiota bacterium]|nr:hypothetical protein [Verrucomicrobiota bacterium]
MVQPIHLEFTRNSETKFICDRHSRFEVRIQRSEIIYRKSFSHRTFGGEALSLKAATIWRDYLLEKAGPPSPRPYSLSKNKRNKTGKVGVGFVKRVHDDSVEITGVIARWRDISGKYISKCFSVRKMGFEKALSIATRLREIKELELSCYHKMDNMVIHGSTLRFHPS